jgi:hypothetical protein
MQPVQVQGHDMQHVHTVSMQRGYAVLTWACSADIQHGHEACTCCTDMQYGYAAWDVQYGQCAVCPLDMLDTQHKNAEWTCSMDKYHGQEERTCNMDMQHGYAAWTSHMDRQHGHAART